MRDGIPEHVEVAGSDTDTRPEIEEVQRQPAVDEVDQREGAYVQVLIVAKRDRMPLPDISVFVHTEDRESIGERALTDSAGQALLKVKSGINLVVGAYAPTLSQDYDLSTKTAVSSERLRLEPGEKRVVQISMAVQDARIPFYGKVVSSEEGQPLTRALVSLYANDVEVPLIPATPQAPPGRGSTNQARRALPD